MNLYAVFADYRKNNEHRYPYYAEFCQSCTLCAAKRAARKRNRVSAQGAAARSARPDE